MAVRFHCRLLTGNLMLSASTALAVTNTEGRKSFIFPRAESPPKIDGALDDDGWLNPAEEFENLAKARIHQSGAMNGRN